VKPISEMVDLNSMNCLKITISEFNGKLRLDIRHYFREGMVPGEEWKPTKKGVNISVDSINEFRKALDKIFSAVAMAEDDEAMESLKCPKCGEPYGDGLVIDGEMARCLSCNHRWEYEL
jgi:DNA-directed RNA polymerase subunit RPC12/RpoP